jgi:hypothetical protein
MDCEPSTMASAYERSRANFDAQESYGRRVIFRSRCHHRIPCPNLPLHEGQPTHMDGLIFADERAAQGFDIRQPAMNIGTHAWQTFASWDEARSWLRRANTELGSTESPA